jgi:Uncharacterised protein family UPF0547
MSQTSLLVFGVGYVVIFGGLTACLASAKNRDGCSWFVLGALIGPLALIAVGLAPATQRPTQPSYTRAAPAVAGLLPGTKVCPECAEEVKWAARVCRFCRHEFGPPGAVYQSDAATPNEDSQRPPGSSHALSVLRYRGDWRVLAADVDALSAGDDVVVLVDDERLRVLKADTVAYEAPVAEVTASGSTTDTRLHLPDGQTILLDWWAGEDGHRLRSALRRM